MELGGGSDSESSSAHMKQAFLCPDGLVWPQRRLKNRQ